MRRPTADAAALAAGLVMAVGVLSPVPGTAQAKQQAPVRSEVLRATSGGGVTAGEGALFLLLPTGAQAVGLGRTMTALPSQEAAFWNPAGLGELQRSRIVVSRGEHLAGEAVAFSLLFTRPPLGSVGLSYQLLDLGDQDRTDERGNVVGELSFRDHLAVVSFAGRVAGRFSAGANFKLVRRQVSCRGSCLDPGVAATTFAVDVGIQGRPVSTVPLRIGAMLAHAGPRLQVVNAEQADPLPTRLRLSWAYDVSGYLLPYPELDLWITAELEDRWRDPGSPSLYLGGEFTAGRADRFYARAGYEAGSSRENQGAAVGVGVRYDGFDVSLAKSLARSGITGEGEPVHVTLAVLFD